MKKVFIAIFTIVLFFCLFLAGAKADDSDVYRYPKVNWQDYGFLQQVELCRIPEDELSAMSSRKLLYAVLDYPLWLMVFASDNSPEAGFPYLYNACDALRELLKRPDGMQELNDLMSYIIKQKEHHQSWLQDYRGQYVFEEYVQLLISEAPRMTQQK